jgi:ethanolamine ammonia-lyase large subunit
VAASVLDGILYGSGNVVIGINPATDNINAVVTLIKFLDDVIQHYDIPIQFCILTHVTTHRSDLSRSIR